MRAVDFGGGEHVLELEPRSPTGPDTGLAGAAGTVPRMRRGVGAVFIAALSLAAAAPAAASPGAQYGIQDDAWLMYGPGTLDERVTTLEGLGVGIVRFTVRWDAVAATKPAHPRDPGDTAYGWGAYGDVLDALHAARHPRARDALGLAALGERRRPAEPAAGDRGSATSRPPLPRASRGCACGRRGTSRTAVPSRARSRRAST